jgi:hypothetical protein
MAGSQINSYGIGDVNLTSLMASVDAERIGFCAVSLTNYDNTSEPEIAEGSKIEVNGALFKFDADEAIGGSPSDGTVYIKLIPVSTSITAEFTNTAPTWDTEKQGWYSPTPGEENYRYIPFEMYKAGTLYYDKRIINEHTSSMLSMSQQGLGISDMSAVATIAKVQGTIGGDNSFYTDYPAGFTAGNTIILDVAISQYGGWTSSMTLSAGTRSADIFVTSTVSIVGSTVRVILMRIGA